MENNLRKIGKAAFVKYFDIFRSRSREEIIEFFTSNGIYDENGANIRAGYANQIFAEGMERAALENISNSTKVEPQIKNQAREMLNQLNAI